MYGHSGVSILSIKECRLVAGSIVADAAPHAAQSTSSDLAADAHRSAAILGRHSLLRPRIVWLVDTIPGAEYSRGMKVKTSITLSDELIRAIDKYGKSYKNRSDFIEAAIWAFIGQIIRERQNARDIELINRNADRLNAEAHDVLAYQVPL